MNEIEFFGSFEKVEQCPELNMPEYAFTGRSNVGKSSLINYLTNRKELARISKKPGKTQTINLFGIDSNWVMADLPGYGYAKVSKSMREKWTSELGNYLTQRPNLVCAMVLIDASISPQRSDIEFINQLGEWRVPWVLVYTKVDKITKSKRKQQLQQIRQAILAHWEELPPEFITSAEKREGRDALLDFISETNKLFQPG